MKKAFIIIVLLYTSLNSQTWVQKLTGYSFWSVNKDIQGNVYAGTSGTLKFLFMSTDQGNDWDTLIANSPSNFLFISVDSLGVIYAANVSNGLMRSSNGGLNWTNKPISDFGGHNVNAVACGRNSWVFVGVTGGGVWRSTDNGSTFTNVGLSTYNIVSLLVDRTNPSYIYAGSSSTSANGFYRSTDGGNNWSDNLNSKNCYYLMQKPNNNIYIAVTNSPYTFERSTNLGANWTSLHAFSGAMRGVCCDIAGNIYTAGNGGAFKSTNDGVSFVNAGITFSSNQVTSIGNKVFVASIGSTNGGIWILTDTTLTGINTKSNVAGKYILHQNYPNPFNPVTEIDYEIPDKLFVKIVVYDMLGNQIDVLVNNVVNSGMHKVSWNGIRYASGIYYYKLTAGDYQESKKMILIK